MTDSSDDICPQPGRLPQFPTEPLAAPIWLSSVYRCHDPQQAEEMLAGTLPGYVYSREGHPNAQLLAEKCRALHGAPQGAVVASGMAALAVVLLAQCQQGDHLVVSDQLYGRSHAQWVDEAARLGIASTIVDTTDLKATAAAMTDRTKLLLVETISNPLLRVADLSGLAEIAHSRGAKLVVDNTFASPAICRPLELGADLVVESLTKIMNGHSDVLLGLICGRDNAWDRVSRVLATYGFTAAPFECWLAERGLGTLHLRIERAADNALAAARFLAELPQVEAVHYPGLDKHPDHALAARQFGGRYGWMVTFTLRGDLATASRFISAAKRIPFCPSLGDICTTLNHPASTSHRLLSREARSKLGILDGTIRLSVGIESEQFVLDALTEALAAVG
ncbi:MAG TPA: aminotransferase class I/II-fold pyridoxal phosphate-dependent enzyme [Pirellulales bacterium]|jgi:cystathionine beta-lyase/cystathionine gamma-synthase|nr:aminotransferase class I/II-fold pyridoxal phosphate-dependent enzyme [Pirellulales bacterium]